MSNGAAMIIRMGRVPALGTNLTDTHTTEESGKKRRPIFFGWYMVAASVATNTIFSAAYFQGFGVLIIPIERTFGWDRWVISAAMSLRQLESGIVSPAVGFLLDRYSARKLIFWSAVISGAGFIGLSFTTGIVGFFSSSWSFPWEHPASAMRLPGR